MTLLVLQIINDPLNDTTLTGSVHDLLNSIVG